MFTLDAKNIEIVQAFLKGARLAKFNASVAIIQESLAQGSWITRGSIKSQSGFYQGLAKIRRESHTGRDLDLNWYCVAAVSSPIEYGGAPHLMTPHDAKDKKAWDAMTLAEKQAQGIKALRAAGGLAKVSDEVLSAWLALTTQVRAVRDFLDAARPAPKVTAIGLSPKVTATLKEMNLDLDLPSIKPAKIEPRQRDAWFFKKDTGESYRKKLKDGSWEQETYYVVVWTDGIVHYQSRFGGTGNCEACNKNIPSKKFVPVEAFDKKSNKLISLWLGCDCSRNIFGIQDVGVEKS